MAAVFVAGVLVGSTLSWAPVPLLAGIGPLGLALRRPAGVLVACASVGLLVDAVVLAPTRSVFEGLVSDTPVSLVGDVEGCWRPSVGGASALFRVRVLATPDRTHVVDRRIGLSVPEDASRPRCGGSLRVRGYLRPPTIFFNEPVVRVGRWRLWVKSERLVSLLEEPSAWARLSAGARRELADAPRDRGEGAGTGLARALLFGEPRALPDEQVAALRRLGLGHLLAVSGLHVGMVAGVAYLLALGLPRRLRLLAVLTATLGYAVVVGPRPSVLRAALMTVILGLALLARRPPLPAHALGVSVIALVVWDPGLASELGFQLSVAATAGILLWVPTIVETRRRHGKRLERFRWISIPIAVTIAAQIATLPWAITAFHRISPVAPFLNVVAVPWAAVTLVFSLLWAVLTVGVPASTPASLAVVALDALARPPAWLATLPASRALAFTVVAGWGEVVWWAGVIVGAVWGLRSRVPTGTGHRTARLSLVLVFLLTVVAAGTLATRGSAPGEEGVAAVFFDVGQGDAVLLVDRGRAVLVDAGGWRGSGFGTRVVRPALAAVGTRRLDAAIVTHADWDHCGGVVDLVREVAIGMVWSGVLDEGSECAQELESTVSGRLRRLSVGDRLGIGRWEIFVLAARGAEARNANARSLVLRASALGRRILLTGDADAATERHLLRRWSPAVLDVDILKVGHHGSKSSTGADLLAVAKPDLAIISVARHNSYGHPATPVLDRLRRHGAGVFRTDLHGRVELRWSEGSAVEVKTLRAPSVDGLGV